MSLQGKAQIEKLVYSGDGLIRKSVIENENKTYGVIFIPYVIPNEIVKYEITSVKKNFARAKLVAVVEPAANRVTPRCSHFGVCGGCQLQHIQYNDHAKIKKGWLQEALYKVLPKTMPIGWRSQEPVWQWRRKITLHTYAEDGAWQIGYWTEKGSGTDREIVNIRECPIFFAHNETHILNDIKNCIATFFTSHTKVRPSDYTITISIVRKDFQKEQTAQFGLHIVFTHRQRLPSLLQNNIGQYLHSYLQKFSWIAQASWEEKSLHTHAKNYHLFGTPHSEIHIDGLSFTAPFQAFVQHHPTLCLEIWKYIQQKVVSIASKIQSQTPLRVLDLYSGIGVTAYLIAQEGMIVHAVEYSACLTLALHETIKKAKKNCGISLTIHTTSVETALSPKSHVIAKGSDIWCANPPRDGMSQTVLAQLATGSFGMKGIYTSCNPTTLARDIEFLAQYGWKIVSIQGFDMFPMTTHFETVLELEKQPL